jgi:hypothetical protein
VIEFLHRLIGPSDYFAALTPDVSVKDLLFGQRTETIEHAIDSYWPRSFTADVMNTGGMPTPISVHEEFLQTCFQGRFRDIHQAEALIRELFNRWRTELVITGLHDLTLRVPQIRDIRTTVLLVSSPWPRFGTSTRLMQDAWNTPSQVGDTVDGKLTAHPRLAGTLDTQACDAELMRLSALDETDMFQALRNAAQRANLSFDVVDPGGLAAFDGGPQASDGYAKSGAAGIRTSQLSMNLDELRVLAINTNGTAIVATNDLRTPLRKLADDLSSYYVLGYYTTNPRLDGKYRSIDVKVKTTGAKVSARRGYFGPTEAMLHPPATVAAPAPEVKAAAETVTAALTMLAGHDPSAQLATYAASLPSETAIVIEIGSNETGRWPDGAEVSAVVTTTGAGSTTVAGHIDAGMRGVVLRLPAAAEPAHARITVKGSGGTLNDRIEIPAGRPSLVGDPIVFRAMASPRAPLQPVADMRFLRSERLRVEWTVAKRLDRREVRLLDRAGQPLAVTVTVTEREASGRTMLDADLALAPLATGDYLIEVIAASGSGPVERRLLAIHVDR